MVGIFLSYRRDDTGPICQRLAGELMARLGKDHVFIDIDSIAGGEPFPQQVRQALNECSCVAVLIGPRWSTITNSLGQRRLFDPDDYVRFEVETALSSDKRVVPILIDEATMPQIDDLPFTLQKLIKCQPLVLAGEQALDQTALQLHSDALDAEIHHMPRVAFPLLFSLILVLGVLGGVLLPQNTFGRALLPAAVYQIILNIFGFGAFIVVGMAVWRVVQLRLWFWLAIYVCTFVFLYFGPNRWQIPAFGVFGLAMLLFSSVGPRLQLHLQLARLHTSAKDNREL